MIYLGIDPGVHTGLALWDTKQGKRGEFIELPLTTTFWGAINYIARKHALLKGDFTVVTENPDENKPVFISRYKPETVKVALKVAQDIGKNKMQGLLLIDYCKANHIPYRAVKPIAQKWSEAGFTLYTKIQDKVSQHAIDAARLVYGL